MSRSHKLLAVVMALAAGSFACATLENRIQRTAETNFRVSRSLPLGTSEAEARAHMATDTIPAPWHPSGLLRDHPELTNPWAEQSFTAADGTALHVLVYYDGVSYGEFVPNCEWVAVRLIPLAFSGDALVARSWAELEALLQTEVPPRSKIWGAIPKCA